MAFFGPIGWAYYYIAPFAFAPLLVARLGQAWWLALLVVVLALLVVTTLGNRRRMQILLDRVEAPAVPLELLADLPPDVPRELERAQEIWLVGISLARTVYTYYSILAHHVSDGGRLRILLVNPASPAAEITATRTLARRTPDHQQKLIRQTLGQLRELAAEAGASEGLEIRLTDYLPPFTGIYINPQSASRGRIYIDYHAYRMSSGDGPRLALRPQHGRWWEHYHSQFESLWVYATPWVRATQPEDAVPAALVAPVEESLA